MSRWLDAFALIVGLFMVTALGSAVANHNPGPEHTTERPVHVEAM